MYTIYMHACAYTPSGHCLRVETVLARPNDIYGAALLCALVSVKAFGTLVLVYVVLWRACPRAQMGYLYFAAFNLNSA